MNIGHAESVVRSVLTVRESLLTEFNSLCEYPLYRSKLTDERLLMRSYPAYILNLEASHFDSVLETLAANQQMSIDRSKDVKQLFRKFRREELCISEKAEFGLPLPVLTHRRNSNMILSED